jgi:DNA-binding transcriptional ArsR family regulator
MHLRTLSASNILVSMHDLRRLKAEIFQALGHPTRLAILEGLQDGEQTVGTIRSRLRMQQGNVSQHLAILRSRRLVQTRREGNHVYYSLRDPILAQVLLQMRRYTASHLVEDLALLRELDAGTRPARRSVRRRRPAGPR